MKVTNISMQFFLTAACAQAFMAPSKPALVPSTHHMISPASSLSTPAPASDWEKAKIVDGYSNILRIEGQTRKTWSFPDTDKETVQVACSTNGRPMEADIQLWIGPDWTPLKLTTYSEDGSVRPIQTLLGTRNKSATVEVRNTNPQEYPLEAACAYAKPHVAQVRHTIPDMGTGRYVEGGGAVYSVPFEPTVNRVQVLLRTETRQLDAKIELLNGPNNIKQLYHVFTNNGQLNSMYVVFETPGSGNVVRIKNQAPLEFPLKAFVSAA